MAPSLRFALLLALSSAAPISDAPAQKVPRAIGFTRVIAEGRFKDQNLPVTFQPADVEDAAGNVRVKSTAPVSGTPVGTGGGPVVATLVELSDKDKRIVPELIGLTLAEAIQELAFADLGVARFEVQPASAPSDSLVEDVAPKAGEEVDLSEIISVYVITEKVVPEWVLVAIGVALGVALGWIGKSMMGAKDRAMPE